MLDPPAFFAAFVLPSLAALLIVWWLVRRRRQALAAVAQRLGLRFAPGVRRLDPRLRAFEAVRRGRLRRMEDELSGTYRGRRVRCFDFLFVDPGARKSTSRQRGVAFVEVPRAWPRLLVVPERPVHGVLKALGMEEVDFESQAFSDRFWVRADDRKFAYDVIDPRMMEFLMQKSPRRWEIRDGLLCLWDEGPWRPEEIPEVLDRLVGFVERVPRHAWARAEPGT